MAHFEGNSREGRLKKQFNSFWQKLFNSTVDYYEQLSPELFLGLKNVVSDINNIITMKATNKFADELYRVGCLTCQDYQNLLKEIDKTNPNTNGYDVDFTRADHRQIIAEVKCNIPVNDAEFGAAQVDSIIKDFAKLWSGQGKKLMTKPNAYKFFVMLYSKEGNQKEAMKKLITSKKFKELGIAVQLCDPICLPKCTDCVYVVFVEL